MSFLFFVVFLCVHPVILSFLCLGVGLFPGSPSLSFFLFFCGPIVYPGKPARQAGRFVGYVWGTVGRCLAGFWKVFGRCLKASGDCWEMFGSFLENCWEVWGRSGKNVRKMLGIVLEDFW